jgi:hypothetical protein
VRYSLAKVVLRVVQGDSVFFKEGSRRGFIAPGRESWGNAAIEGRNNVVGPNSNHRSGALNSSISLEVA